VEGVSLFLFFLTIPGWAECILGVSCPVSGAFVVSTFNYVRNTHVREDILMKFRVLRSV